MSLRYIDEFIALKCAPELLSMKLFPNSKEITESMSVFTAFREYILYRGIELGPHDAVICVGDGSTPRTAALFAQRLPTVQCYSIDPALAEYVVASGDADKMATRDDIDLEAMTKEDRSYEAWNEIAPQVCVRAHDMVHPWCSVDRLHVLPFKIENVRLRCARAVVVLLHAHVSLEDIRKAVSANIIGIVSVPCCNFGLGQSSFLGRGPDYTFEDPQMLSDKNELRVWCSSVPSTAARSATAVNLDAILLPPKETSTAMRNTRSRRVRDAVRARLLAGPLESRLLCELVAPRSFQHVFAMCNRSCEGQLCSLSPSESSGVVQTDAGTADTVGGTAKARVDLDLVMLLGAATRAKCSAGEIAIDCVTSGDVSSPVVRMTVRVKNKKYESSYLLILAVTDGEGLQNSDEDQSEIQIILSKKYLGSQVEGDTAGMVGGFDNLRDSIRNGDLLEVVGCPGRTSFGDPALFVWDVFLVSMTLPFDVIHTASCVEVTAPVI